jgi:hypothetical protein
MKTLATLIRHVVTYAVGLLVSFLTVHLSGVELQTGVDAANALVEPLVVLVGLLGVIASRLAMPFLHKLFRAGSGDTDDGPAGGLSPVVIGMVGTAVAIGGSLPSCSPAQLEALRGVPIRLGVETDDSRVSYSSKGGLLLEARVRREK